MSHPISISACTSCRLWIDGVGVYDLWFSPTLTIGNAFVDEKNAPKLALLADLRTRHIDIERTGDNYFATPHGETHFNYEPVTTRQVIQETTLMKLGEGVRLQWSKPSPLSSSMLITFPSHHQPQHRSDGLLMFDHTCILGSNEQSHIRCANMEQSVVLFERDDQLWAKSPIEFRQSNDTEQKIKVTLLTNGSTLTGDGWQFRVEKGFSL